MKSPPFSYARPTTCSDALAVLSSDPDARPLAGGQSLLPLLGVRLAAPTVLVDLEGIPELCGIQQKDAVISIGAMTRQSHAETSKLLAEHFPVVVDALQRIGYPAIRNRGTVGGSLAHADPAAELPLLAVALEAQLIVDGPGGRRAVPAGEFYHGPFASDLGPGELLTAVHLPINDLNWAFLEFSRRHADFAVVAVAVGLRIEDGRPARARIAVGAAHPHPIRLPQAEEALVGRLINHSLAEEVAEQAATMVSPASDVHGSADYRRHIAAVLVRRAILQAAGVS